MSDSGTRVSSILSFNHFPEPQSPVHPAKVEALHIASGHISFIITGYYRATSDGNEAGVCSPYMGDQFLATSQSTLGKGRTQLVGAEVYSVLSVALSTQWAMEFSVFCRGNKKPWLIWCGCQPPR